MRRRLAVGMGLTAWLAVGMGLTALAERGCHDATAPTVTRCICLQVVAPSWEIARQVLAESPDPSTACRFVPACAGTVEVVRVEIDERYDVRSRTPTPDGPTPEPDTTLRLEGGDGSPGSPGSPDWRAESVIFDGGELGRLTWPDGRLHFEGDADASARVFFEGTLKDLVDDYVRAQCAVAAPHSAAERGAVWPLDESCRSTCGPCTPRPVQP